MCKESANLPDSFECESIGKALMNLANVKVNQDLGDVEDQHRQNLPQHDEQGGRRLSSTQKLLY